MSSKEFNILMKRLDRIEAKIVPQNVTWLTEDQAMQLTDLSRSSLLRKRKQGIFNFSSVTGRKVKYWKKDIENYIDNNSTL